LHHVGGSIKGNIKRNGGWRTRSVFERYAIVNESDISDAMQKLARSQQQKNRYGNYSGAETTVPTKEAPPTKD